jgi:transposase-like protein
MKTSKPDIDDPNRTCRPCSYVFANKFCYRRHLLTVHKMTLESLEKSIPRRPKPQTDLSPVVDDPNHTCRSCEYQFSSRFAYRKHLWVIHKMKLERLKRIKPTLEPQPNISPVVDDPNNNCRSCNHQFSNKRWYRSHLFNVHKIRLDSSRVGKWKARQSISPVVDDPNYQFFSSGNYRGHVLMKLEPLESSTSRLTPHLNISPVVDDPDNNCRSCEYQFSSRYTYRRHLITIHKIKLGPIGKSVPKLKPQPNITPVVDDPNNNCRSCNYQFTSKNGYRGHLLRTHKMKLKPLGKSVPKLKPQPNITPVVDDPNNICQSCNYQFSSKYAYKAHLMRHRKLDLESLQKK